jgi:hypothetical protein
MIITILRKPLEGSVADNTLKHGCGAINIDATRVGTEARTYKDMGNKVGNQENASGSSIYWMSKPPTTKSKREGASGDVVHEVEGRWPANFILTHLDGCELKGTKKVKEHQKDRSLTDVKTVKDNEAWVGHADKDGKETVADWACVEGCPVKELDRQSGQVKGWSSQNHNTFNPYQGNSFHNSSTQRQGYKEGYNDEGGASRFFKQFKKGNN